MCHRVIVVPSGVKNGPVGGEAERTTAEENGTKQHNNVNTSLTAHLPNVKVTHTAFSLVKQLMVLTTKSFFAG